MRCVACNRRISKRSYFCEECLREEIGEPPKRTVPGLLSQLVLLPFRMISPVRDRDDRLRWAVQRMKAITKRYPRLPSDRISSINDTVCAHVGLNDDADRRYVLSEVRRIKLNKNGPVWAPWDIVLQPGGSFLLITIGILGLILLVSIL